MATMILRWARRAAIAAAVLAVTGCNGESCSQAGKTYEEGERWTCADGCNECACSEGQITNTDKLCTAPGAAAGQRMCLDGGDAWHAHGTSWTCADGCCSCSDGELSNTPGECGS